MLDTVIPLFWKSLKVRLVVDFIGTVFISITDDFPENDVSGHTIVSLVVAVTFGVFIIIVITAILVLSLYKLLPKCCKLCC